MNTQAKLGGSTMLNMRHLLIIALGYNDSLRDEIDTIYNKNRWIYYETFKESGFYEDVLIKSFTTQREEKMKKVAGIVEWAYNNDDMSNVDKLIKKGYNIVVRYYQENKRNIDLLRFNQYLVRKRKNLSEIDSTMYDIVLLYIAYKDGQNIATILRDDYGQLILGALQEMFTSAGARMVVEHEIEKASQKLDEAIAFIEKLLGIKLSAFKNDSVDILFDKVINIKAEEKLVQGRNYSTEYITNLRNKVFLEGATKYIGGYTAVFQLFGLNYNDILNIEVTKEDLIIYARNALDRRMGNKFTLEECEQFFIASLYIHTIMKQYTKQKGILIDDTNESWYLDVKNREKYITDKEERFEKKEQELMLQVKRQEESLRAMKEEMKVQQKELERLKEEQKSNKEDMEELVELRSFVYGQKRKDIANDDDSLGMAIESLKSKRLVICGGHVNMQRKLKESLPTLEFLSTETLGKNFNYLKNYDVVFFYPNYANHTFYKKIKMSLRNSSTQLIYLPDKDNLEYILMYMYQQIKN